MKPLFKDFYIEGADNNYIYANSFFRSADEIRGFENAKINRNKDGFDQFKNKTDEQLKSQIEWATSKLLGHKRIDKIWFPGSDVKQKPQYLEIRNKMIEMAKKDKQEGMGKKEYFSLIPQNEDNKKFSMNYSGHSRSSGSKKCPGNNLVAEFIKNTRFDQYYSSYFRNYKYKDSNKENENDFLLLTGDPTYVDYDSEHREFHNNTTVMNMTTNLSSFLMKSVDALIQKMGDVNFKSKCNHIRWGSQNIRTLKNLFNERNITTDNLEACVNEFNRKYVDCSDNYLIVPIVRNGYSTYLELERDDSRKLVSDFLKYYLGEDFNGLEELLNVLVEWLHFTPIYDIELIGENITILQNALASANINVRFNDLQNYISEFRKTYMKIKPQSTYYLAYDDAKKLLQDFCRFFVCDFLFGFSMRIYGYIINEIYDQKQIFSFLQAMFTQTLLSNLNLDANARENIFEKLIEVRDLFEKSNKEFLASPFYLNYEPCKNPIEYTLRYILGDCVLDDNTINEYVKAVIDIYNMLVIDPSNDEKMTFLQLQPERNISSGFIIDADKDGSGLFGMTFYHAAQHFGIDTTDLDKPPERCSLVVRKKEEFNLLNDADYLQPLYIPPQRKRICVKILGIASIVLGVLTTALGAAAQIFTFGIPNPVSIGLMAGGGALVIAGASLLAYRSYKNNKEDIVPLINEVDNYNNQNINNGEDDRSYILTRENRDMAHDRAAQANANLGQSERPTYQVL